MNDKWPDCQKQWQIKCRSYEECVIRSFLQAILGSHPNPLIGSQTWKQDQIAEDITQLLLAMLWKYFGNVQIWYMQLYNVLLYMYFLIDLIDSSLSKRCSALLSFISMRPPAGCPYNKPHGPGLSSSFPSSLGISSFLHLHFFFTCSSFLNA